MQDFGSGGVGTANHLTNEFLKHLERIDMVHVPYKGVTQADTPEELGELLRADIERYATIARSAGLAKQ